MVALIGVSLRRLKVPPRRSQRGIGHMTIAHSQNPFTLFDDWFSQAVRSGIKEPTAMALSTVSGDGAPDVRMVLLKGHGPAGFVFYTNLASPKARAIAAHPLAALCFYWNPPGRQVRIRGTVEPVTGREADEYFASRDRLSRIGAWASKQSEPLESRFGLEQRVARYTARFGLGAIPRPEFWSGFRVVPGAIEFWEQRASRLHERLLFTRAGEDWTKTSLYP